MPNDNESVHARWVAEAWQALAKERGSWYDPALFEIEPPIVAELYRAAGLDPDGPRVPMPAAKTDRQIMMEIDAENNRHTQAYYLCRAINFT